MWDTHIIDQLLTESVPLLTAEFRTLSILLYPEYRDSRPYIEMGGQFQALAAFKTGSKSPFNHSIATNPALNEDDVSLFLTFRVTLYDKILTVFLTAISALLIRTLTRKQQNYEKL
jgi:hypothetical protein